MRFEWGPMAGLASVGLVWAAGGHLLGLAGSALLFCSLLVFSNSRPQIVLGAMAPIPMVAGAIVDNLLDWQTLFLVPAAFLAWIPLWRTMGRAVPWTVWIYPVALMLMVPILISPWALSVVDSDIATRVQVLLLGALALVLSIAGRAASHLVPDHS